MNAATRVLVMLCLLSGADSQQPPQIFFRSTTGPGSSIQVTEHAPRGTIIGLVFVSTDGPGTVTCSASSTENVAELQVLPDLGDDEYKLVLTSVLDRETRPFHDIFINCTSSGDHPLSSVLSCHLHVLDVNDNAPVFVTPSFNFNVNLTTPAGSVVGRVDAVDQDMGQNAAIAYSLEPAPGEDSILPVMVDPLTGELTTLRTMQVEPGQCEDLIVWAQDMGTPSLTSIASVFLCADSLQPPQIVIKGITGPDNSSIQVTENAPRGTIVGLVSVSTDGPGTVTCSASSTENVAELQVLPDLGDDEYKLVLTSVLDRETRPFHDIFINCTSNGDHPLSSVLSCRLHVLDVNDNAPVFVTPSYNFNVNLNTPAGSVVGRVMAVDQDMGRNAAIAYSLEPTSFLPVKVDPRTGELTTLRTMQVEPGQCEELIVWAQDMGTPSLTSRASVFLCADSLQPPQIVIKGITGPDNSSLQVTENAPRGTIVGSVSVSTDGPGTVTCSASSTGNVAELQVLPDLGDDEYKLVLTSVLDRETRSLYDILINCTSSGDHPLSSVLSCRLHVLDVNDNAPVFVTPSFNFNVNLTTPAGSVVGRVDAVDQDMGQNAAIAYSLEPAPGEDSILPVMVDPRTGELTTLRTMQVELGQCEELIVWAQDMGTPSLTSRASVFMCANSMQPPQIVIKGITGPDNSSLQVTENAPRGTIIGLVSVSTDGPGTVTCSASSTENVAELQVLPDLGDDEYKLVLTSVLDRETRPFHDIFINCTSNGDHPLSSVLSCRLHVLDVNDNAPVFVTPSYNFNVNLNTPAGSVVGRVMAVDQDMGRNAAIAYSLEPTSFLPVMVDPRTGELTTLRTMQVEPGQCEELTVWAQDMGTPSLTSRASVFLCANSMQPPQIVIKGITGPDNSSLQVTENAPRGTIIGLVSVSTDGPGTVTCSASSTENVAELQVLPDLGDDEYKLVLTSVLDRETRPFHDIFINCTSNGDHPLSSVLSCRLHVLDVNDNAPVFVTSSYNFNVNLNTPAGSVVGRVMAVDQDMGRNAAIAYSLEPTSILPVKVDPRTGELTTLRRLQTRAGHREYLIVRARDMGEPSLTSSASVILTIL
ncbi:protein dachsous-like [Babylonia areolata]|uniref:protein dachsous-like n=1 Tax=Babylonia areolata TaxID=304850 RepID=UPI003FD27A74